MSTVLQPLFVFLGDQITNMNHVHYMRVVPDRSAPAGVSVAVSMPTPPYTFNWTPKSKEELEWLHQVCQVLRPGELPKSFAAHLEQADKAARPVRRRDA